MASIHPLDRFLLSVDAIARRNTLLDAIGLTALVACCYGLGAGFGRLCVVAVAGLAPTLAVPHYASAVVLMVLLFLLPICAAYGLDLRARRLIGGDRVIAGRLVGYMAAFGSAASIDAAGILPAATRDAVGNLTSVILVVCAVAGVWWIARTRLGRKSGA